MKVIVAKFSCSSSSNCSSSNLHFKNNRDRLRSIYEESGRLRPTHITRLGSFTNSRMYF